MNNEEFSNAELTQFVRVHNAAIAQHERWLTGIQATLDRVAESQAQTQAQQALNTQAIASLTANIEGLRNQVADYMSERGRQ
jgi:maleate cis-trans isomerase